MPVAVRIGIVVALFLVSRLRQNERTEANIASLSWSDKLALVWNLTHDKRIPLWARIPLLAPAAYLLSPIDLLPDFIPFLGKLDDSLVFSMGMSLATILIPNDIIEEHVLLLSADR
jgi:uncharacterized membrane protein YkvA (DUF1232 family)